MARLLVLDENLPRRLKTELDKRGRPAKRLNEFGLVGNLDPSLIASLSDSIDTLWVLVTADDAMPLEHGAILRQYELTVATIDPWKPHGRDTDSWRRDVVHRWVHAMDSQADRTTMRYSLSRGSIWRVRKRRPPSPDAVSQPQ
jgi:hypothetical protein